MKNKVYIIFVIVIITILIFLQNEKYVETEPDVVNCIKFNQSESLTVVANRNSITDKMEFAMMLIDMRKNNSFRSVRFSDDLGAAESIELKVYLWEEEIEETEPVMIVEYKPIEEGKGYDIISHPEMYEVYIYE